MATAELLQDTADLDAANKTDVGAWERSGGIPLRTVRGVLKTLNIKRNKNGRGGVSCGAAATVELAIATSFTLGKVVKSGLINANRFHRSSLKDLDASQAVESTDFHRLHPNVVTSGQSTPSEQVVREMQNTRLGVAFKTHEQAKLERQQHEPLEEAEVDPIDVDEDDDIESKSSDESVSSKEDSDDENDRIRDEKEEKALRSKEKKDVKKAAKNKKGKTTTKDKKKKKEEEAKATKNKKKAKKDKEEEEEEEQSAQAPEEEEEKVPEPDLTARLVEKEYEDEDSVAVRTRNRKRKRSAEDDDEGEQDATPAETEGRRYPKKQRGGGKKKD